MPKATIEQSRIHIIRGLISFYKRTWMGAWCPDEPPCKKDGCPEEQISNIYLDALEHALELMEREAQQKEEEMEK